MFVYLHIKLLHIYIYAVSNYNTDYNCVILFQVYDLTTYLDDHPGGDAMLNQAGRDGTEGFTRISAHKHVSKFIAQILEKNYVGELSS